MTTRKPFVAAVAFVAILATAGVVFALGFELRESKEELKLDYTVTFQDNGGERVAVELTIADEGRLKPITGVDLGIPSADGSGYYDLSLTLRPREADGKQVYYVQLTRSLAERAQFSLKTSHVEGKELAGAWVYHRINVKDYMQPARETK